MENTYIKIVPNVWGLKTSQEFNRGDITTITTKYGKENEVIIFNKVKVIGDYNVYSIVRADGFNAQTYAQNKADKRQEWANSAEKKSTEFYEKSNQHREFLSLGEPVKVGHHSENRHRKIIDQSWNNMGKSVEMSDKAKTHEQKAEYWSKKAEQINLSMPESIEYYEQIHEKAKATQQLLKDKPELREHSYSLTYATKAVKVTAKNVELARKLWA